MHTYIDTYIHTHIRTYTHTYIHGRDFTHRFISSWVTPPAYTNFPPYLSRNKENPYFMWTSKYFVVVLF